MPDNGRPTWFKVYAAHLPMFESIADERVGEGLKAAVRYFVSGELPSEALHPIADIVFQTLRAAVDEAFADYEAAVEAGRLGAAARAAKRREKEESEPP